MFTQGKDKWWLSKHWLTCFGVPYTLWFESTVFPWVFFLGFKCFLFFCGFLSDFLVQMCIIFSLDCSKHSQNTTHFYHCQHVVMPFGRNISNKLNTVDLTLYFPKSRCTLCCCQSGNATDGKLAEAYILTCKWCHFMS